MTAGVALRAAILLLAPALAAATSVHVPPVRDGSGALVDAYVDARLITADGKPAIGFGPTDLATEYAAQELPAAGVTLELAPQTDIAMPAAAATYYQITIRAGHRTEVWRIQVPDSGATQELADLVGAEAIAGSLLAAERLVPPGGAADQALCKVTGDDYDTDWCDSAGTETDPVFAASPAAGIGVQDITDWGAAYSWGDHGLMGYLLPGADAATLGSDSAIAGYAPLADGAGGIAWGPIAVSAETYAPSVLTVTYGTLTSGTVADLVEKDGTSVAIAEASGAGTALQLTLDFAGVTSFHSLAIFGQYDGSDSHQIAVEVWDYDASAWEVYGYLPNTDDPQWHFYTIADPEEHVSAGSAQVRLRHIQTGNTTHDLYLDQVYLSGAVAGGAIAHQDLVGRSVADQHPASAISNTPEGSIAATTVQAAINEMDSEKSATSHAHEGAAILSTGETGGAKFLREDGDGTSSWQTVPAAGTNTELQYRNGSALGAVYGSSWDGTTLDFSNVIKAGNASIGGSGVVASFKSSYSTQTMSISPVGWTLTGALTALNGLRTGYDSSYLGFGTSNDVILYRDGVGFLHQRRGTAAQYFSIANTYTNASNYEAGIFDWQATANTLTIGAQAAGTGVVRPVSFVGANFAFNSDAIRITTNRTPSAATDACVAGELFSDDAYIYKCVASGNIKRTAIATW